MPSESSPAHPNPAHPNPAQPAPSIRPERHTVLRSFAGHLDADPASVFAALLQRMQGAPGVAVDADAREIAQQGGWWYRGEYRVMAEPAEHGAEAGAEGGAAASGTRLEYEIVNVAQSWHWAGPIAGRKVLADAPYGFHALLSDIEAELDPGSNAGSEAPEQPTD